MEYTNSRACYEYARDVIMGRFPKGEKHIAQVSVYSYLYALFVIQSPFPAGEAAIATNAEYSYWYARHALGRKPFPLGEPTIAKSCRFSVCYALHVLRSRFPAGEPSIDRFDKWGKIYYNAFPVPLDPSRGIWKPWDVL